MNVIISLTDAPESWRRLGHGYRVEARVVLWRGANVLQVPLSALFRSGENWAVFAVRGSRALLTVVEVGHQNSDAAEIISGLEAGQTVILHPSDRVDDGVLVEPRNQD